MNEWFISSDLVIECFMCLSVSAFSSCAMLRMHKYLIRCAFFSLSLAPSIPLFIFLTRYYATDKSDGKRKMRFKPFYENRIATDWFLLCYVICIHATFSRQTHHEYMQNRFADSFRPLFSLCLCPISLSATNNFLLKMK